MDTIDRVGFCQQRGLFQMTRFYIFTIVCAVMLWCRFGHTNDDALWLARSCIGEAGWNAWETGECAAILHIYKKRSAMTGETPAKLASRYSAAIKSHKGKRNRWVLGLTENAERPHNWPHRLNWQRFRFSWLMTLLVVDMFLHDMTVDPLPRALHYGCVFDNPPPGSVRIKTQFRNRFYR